MDWETVLAEVLKIVSRIIIVIVIPYLASLAKEKIHNDKINKYIDKAQNVVIQCVDYVNQTYVDALKKDGKFDKEAQETAFYSCKERVMYLLNENAKQAVIEVFGDLEFWVDSMIESSVRNSINHIGAGQLIEEEAVTEDEL